MILDVFPIEAKMIDYSAPGFTDKRLERFGCSPPVRVVERQLSLWCLEIGCSIQDRYGQWVLPAVSMGGVVVPGSREHVTAGWNLWAHGRCLVEDKRPCFGIHIGLAGQHMARDAPELLLCPVEEFTALGQADSQPVVNFGVEVLQQLLAGVAHRLRDFGVEVEPELRELRFDGLRRTALLVNGHDPTFEIDPGLDSAQHLVAGTEHSRKQPELLGKKLEHP